LDKFPSVSQPGKIYGLCKAHKKGYPLRPVVSMIVTSEYELAKFLDSFIKPNIPNKYMLNYTQSFLDAMKSFNFDSSDKLISYDVVSLFTCIPLKETINLVSDAVYSEHSKWR